MPHVDGHPDPYGSIARSPRARTRPDVIPPMGKTVSPMMFGGDPENRIGVAGPKGGGEAAKAQVKVGSDIYNKYNNDGRYGYYNDQGYYVPADIDMRDGGGADKSDTFFEGGGFLSLLANIAKIRPYGQENTPREQIGFRNVADMFDRGGPQHSGGEYRGGMALSMLGNLADRIGGVDQGTRTRYNYDTAPTPTATRATGDLINNIEPRTAIPAYDLSGNPQNDAALNEVATTAISKGREPLYRPSQTFTMTDRAAAIAALKARHGDSWERLVAEEPKEAEELIQEAMRMQNPLFPADP